MAFVQENFTLDGGEIDPRSIVELNSYDDRNYYVRTVDGEHEYTIKVHNGVESGRPGLLAAQSAIMRHLNAHGVSAPVPIKRIGNSSRSCGKVRVWQKTSLSSCSPSGERAEISARACMPRVDLDTWRYRRARRAWCTHGFLRGVGEFWARWPTLESFQHRRRSVAHMGQRQRSERSRPRTCRGRS